MHQDDEYENDDDAEDKEDDKMRNMARMFEALHRKAKSHVDYLLAEGFIIPTDEVGVYEYTPEGMVLLYEKYKQMQREEE
jgi:predicted transcriptional regulator